MPTYNVNVQGGGILPTADVSSKAVVIKNALALNQLNNTSDLGKPVTTALTAALVPFVNISPVADPAVPNRFWA